MTAASDLWAAVVAGYDSDGLVSLTNIRNRGATTADSNAGESAAQDVVDLWPLYAQAAYDPLDAQHVVVGKRAVIAVLWSRGGTASSIAKVEYDEVFGDEGLISKVRKTGARARPGPSSSSGSRASSEVTSGRAVRPWSDPESISQTHLPRRIIAEDY